MGGILSKETKLSLPNIALDMREVYFNVMNKEITEATYLKLKYNIKVQTPKSTRERQNYSRDFTEIGCSFMEEDTWLIKIIWSKEEILTDWKMGVVHCKIGCCYELSTTVHT
jgi:hypothetical protein